ncbi:MAG: response regulator [Planctomycetota bacterium]|nr:response regulator [Planctomycetota bacterium]
MGRDTVLVIEDEADLREVLAYNLKREGYRVVTSHTGTDGLQRCRDEKPTMVLLDLMLPDLDGVEICQQIRHDPAVKSTPIIMVTAKGDESDVVLGLGVGADDYVTKPFSPKELIARVKAVLRRRLADTEDEGDRVLKHSDEHGTLLIDPVRHEVQVDGETVYFTATEFRLLRYLAARPGRVYSRDQLLRAATGDDTVLVERNVDVHVRAIRKKLGVHRDMIETVRGVGYRFKDTGR